MIVFLLYETDALHTAASRELLFVGSSIDKCYFAAHCKGATKEQVKQLQNFRQSQCNNCSCEFDIEEREVDCL